MVVAVVPAAAAAMIAVIAAAHANAGMRAHRSHVRAGTNAVCPHTGSHADRADLHASADLCRRDPRGA
jgi:hypothetical protein